MLANAKEQMLQEHLEARGVHDLDVLRAMRIVPREAFLPAEIQINAYEDNPLPIGHGQTISQPYIVGIMTQLLHILPGDRILEIGSGCGYQAAVLSRIAKAVHTVERIPSLAAQARANLAALDYNNAYVHLGDGGYGWPEEQPYDGIIVTAAPESLPDRLLHQLKPGGRLIIPIGPRNGVQLLQSICKELDGSITPHTEMAVRFVPLISSQNR